MKLSNALSRAGITITLAVLAFMVIVHDSTFQPAPRQGEGFVSPLSAPRLKPGQKIKILSWNIQYMAGKNRVFFYDVPDGNGPDERPSSKEIKTTRGEIKRIIDAENPDIILIQEIDEGSKRTDYENQLALLLGMLPKEYSSYSSAFYHKAAFLPHPRIRGSVGLKLAVISKYRITGAVRHQLPVIPDNLLVKQFNFKRCVLEVRMPVEGRKDLAVFDTHLDAFAQGSDTMKRQVEFVMDILDRTTKAGHDWVIGGDFNLLPPGKAYERLPESHRVYFNEKTELAPLIIKYRSVPGLAELNGPDYRKWFTHYPNDPSIQGPDRTIDYLFFSDAMELRGHYVRQADTLKISDHLPLVAEIIIPL
ncbi:MAG TPA: endonuclease/exonuclease/phosphatase family protein [Spirochaetota bacterium]|nr:endonuclease/exonuclease/phosphatase family protein [Spirochaetota bacterium]HPC39632.1 endonuclease/exonuclease/phosphatase family protein [Spirochaetota bacterium]HPL16005.1 endonuclease/exonuclease/phosphatase family protein [Spirochaetota bacterium]HQF07358.1 endonuclease/exonuclease/phosphatase family protein [Spirochaetota bacterium]HQH99216.1 endonuclease/exonuclease/phosphatase family protein [Spirochaetota bacterium]